MSFYKHIVFGKANDAFDTTPAKICIVGGTTNTIKSSGFDGVDYQGASIYVNGSLEIYSTKDSLYNDGTLNIIAPANESQSISGVYCSQGDFTVNSGKVNINTEVCQNQNARNIAVFADKSVFLNGGNISISAGLEQDGKVSKSSNYAIYSLAEVNFGKSSDIMDESLSINITSGPSSNGDSVAVYQNAANKSTNVNNGLVSIESQKFASNATSKVNCMYSTGTINFYGGIINLKSAGNDEDTACIRTSNDNKIIIDTGLFTINNWNESSLTDINYMSQEDLEQPLSFSKKSVLVLKQGISSFAQDGENWS